MNSYIKVFLPLECCRCNKSFKGNTKLRVGGEVSFVDVPFCSECAIAMELEIIDQTDRTRRVPKIIFAVSVALACLYIFISPDISQYSWLNGLILAFPAAFIAGIPVMFAKTWSDAGVKARVAKFSGNSRIMIFGNQAYQARFDALNGPK